MHYGEIVDRWQKLPISDTADIDLKLHNFRILFAYHSCKMENEDIEFRDTKDIFENGKVSGYSGDIRTLFRQQNQKDCHELLKGSMVDKETLSLQLIKEAHFELCKGTYGDGKIPGDEKPGEFKKRNYISGSDPGNVEEELKGLLEEVNAYGGGDPIKTAAYLLAMFEGIRPFAGGNGCTARTIMNYYLVVHDHPPVIIFYEDRKQYRKAQETFENKKTLDLFTVFLQQQFEKTWSKS